MYPILQLRDRSWMQRTIDGLAAFAAEHRDELRACRRELRFPRELYREMGRRGWIGTITPETHGGSGGGAAEYCLVAEEVARHGLVSPQISVQGQRWLMEWGSAGQREQWLRGVATGEIVFSECISEPTVGSSFKDVRATAARDGSDWVLDGEKVHVNLGADCELTIFYGMAEEGLTSFLVEMREPGIETRRTDPIGLRLIPTADVRFSDVRVPAGAILGEPGGGLQTFLSTFNLSRLGNASELIGLSRRAIAQAIDYARDRKVGDDVVTGFQGIQWTVADIHAALAAAALARDHAANLVGRGEEHALETTTAKKLAIDAAELATNEAFALVGGHGLYHDQEFADLLGEMKVLRVAGGSLEVLRNYIARRVLRGEGYEGLA